MRVQATINGNVCQPHFSSVVKPVALRDVRGGDVRDGVAGDGLEFGREVFLCDEGLVVQDGVAWAGA